MRNNNNTTPTIIIEGAMKDFETKYLIDQLTEPEYNVVGHWEFVKGMYNGCCLVICTTQIGVENAAAATVLAIEKYKPCAIINQGTAGGYPKDLHTLDIVLATKTFSLDAAITVERLKERGMDYKSMFLDMVSANGGVYHKPDELLLQCARNAKDGYTRGKVVEGLISTSVMWNMNVESIMEYHEKYGILAEEMEADAVAHICGVYKVPFLCVRILSNSEVNNEPYNPKAGKYCQEFVLDIVNEYKNAVRW